MGDDNTVEVLNTFFSDIINNLKIEWYSNCDRLANSISDLVLNCLVKYRNHTSILATEEDENKNRKLPSSFSKIQGKEILSDILRLKPAKAYQDTDNPTKIAK